VSLVRKLQADALDPKTPVSSLLRTAKVIATKLNLQDALDWIDRELDGYMGLTAEELPPYRRLSGEPKAWNPYHGWQPIQFHNPDMARKFSQAPIGQALGAIEEGLRGDRNGSYVFPYSPEIKAILAKALGYPTDTTNFISYSQLWGIIDAVRNLVLNWTLELEKAGVSGEDMQFTTEEMKHAQPVSQQFIIQNVGILGNVSGKSSVSNVQTAEVTIDIAKVKRFVEKAREAAHLLPETSRCEVIDLLQEIDATASAEKPSQIRIRKLLESTKNVCEGAAGNVAAEGIMQLIASMLG
jgi:hypothetical protein